MLKLKEQLAVAIGNSLIANIPEQEFVLDVNSSYLTSERIKCVECAGGEANLITVHDVLFVSVKDGDILDLDSYMVLTPYEQAIWDAIYEAGFLSKLYIREDTDGDDIPDTLYAYDNDNESYVRVDGANYYKESDINELTKEGTLDTDKITKERLEIRPDELINEIVKTTINRLTGTDNIPAFGIRVNHEV